MGDNKYSENTMTKFNNLLQSRGQFKQNLTQSIFVWRQFKFLQIFQKGDNKIINQRNGIIIALRQCVYWLELVFQVSDVVYGTLAIKTLL